MSTYGLATPRHSSSILNFHALHEFGHEVEQMKSQAIKCLNQPFLLTCPHPRRVTSLVIRLVILIILIYYSNHNLFT